MYEAALDDAIDSDEPEVRILRPEMVAVTKLVGGRSKDMAAIVDMMQAESIDLDKLAGIVKAYPRLRDAYDRARSEWQRGDGK